MTDAVTLVAQGLSVTASGRELLRDVSLSARAGEVLGVLGPSGAGKSTLFRALSGDGPLATGKILLNGVDVTDWPLWRRARAGLGYVPQSPSVLFDLTVADNLSTYFRIAGAPGQSVEDAADRVQLSARLTVRAGDLSAGERRRLEVARALVTKPKLLICDEPFAGVDPAGAAHIARLLRDVASGGAAVVLADHHVAEALRTCDRALLLLDGAIAVEATPEGFREHPLVRGRYLGTWTPST